MYENDPLFSEDWYSQCYENIARLVRSRNLPSITGNPADINAFIANLILNQRGRDWVRLFGFVLDELSIGTISSEKINMMIRSRQSDPAVRPEIIQTPGLGNALLTFERSPVTFTGTGDEAVEFILRFLLSQISGQWHGALRTVMQKCMASRAVKLSELNKVLEVWDYTRLFERRI